MPAAFHMLTAPPRMPKPRTKALTFLFEVGRKNRNVAFHPQTIKRQILNAVELGVSNAYVERYGLLIKFASVSPRDVVAVDAVRVAMHRMADYRYLGSLPRPSDG